jgi:DegV family protein with EDD domain
MTLAIVTDSTACLPSYQVERLGITVVPVQVTIDDKTFDEGIGISSVSVMSALTRGQAVSTNRPAPEKFAQVYETLAARGATEIVSIHLSSELSGTYSSAVLAAREARVPVRVVDSRTIGLGLGFAVLAAADESAHAPSASHIADIATRRGRAARAWLCVDTLEHLRVGGRIGVAQAAVGSVLAIKPILEVSGGRIVPSDKVRTMSRAIARLTELAVEAAADLGGRVEIGVQHAGAREKVESLSAALGKAQPGVPVVTSDLGAVLSAHVGPGAIAVVVSPVISY